MILFKKLDDYHLTHPIAALGFVLIFMLFGYGVVGCYIAICFYLGREVRDCEVQLGMNFKEGLSKNGLLWALQGFDIRKWSLDNHLDFWPVLIIISVVLWFM